MTKTLWQRGWFVILLAGPLLLGAPPLGGEQRFPTKRATAERSSSSEQSERSADASSSQPRLVSRLAADTCAAAPYLITGPGFDILYSDTTAGQTDNYDLPTDLEAPTCTAPTSCTGGGAAPSLPRGAIYSGTGTAPDRALRIRTNLNCTLRINLVATADLGLIIYQDRCSSLLSDCVCVDDSNGGGIQESVLLQAIARVDYFILVDGYDGASGDFQLRILEDTFTGCELVGATSLDIDGNGEFDALTDALLLVRYAFGFRGGALITGAVAADCTRCSAPQIEAYIGGI